MRLSGILVSLTLVACAPASDPVEGQGGGQVGGGGAGRRPGLPLPEPDPEPGPDAGVEPTPVADTDPAWPEDEPLSPEIDLPPWVTMPAPGTIVISWQTVADTTAEVHFGTTPAYGTTIASNTAAKLHHVDLGELAPATAYYYEVDITSSSAYRRGVFVTPGMANWRFVQVGELHAPSHADDAAVYADAIRAFRPHVLVDSGDMVDDGSVPADWQSYLRTSAPWISNVIILPTHTNHVNGFGGSALLKSLFVLPGNERWYPTRYGQVEFLTVDSTYSVNPDIDTIQLDWLAEQTAAAHDGVDDPALLVGNWHYPACSSHFAERASAREWVMDNLVDTMIDAGGVDLIVVGHDKYYERSLIDGQIVHLMTNMGARAKFPEGGNHERCTSLRVDNETQSLALIEVDGPVMHAQVLDQGGEVLDDFTVER